MNEITVKWNQIYTKGIAVSTSTKINTLLLIDIQVQIDDSEDKWWTGVFTLQNIAKFWNEGITSKSVTIIFLGQVLVRGKIVVDNQCLQVENFKYLNCEISYENEKAIQ